MLAPGVLPRLALRRPGPFLIPPCLPRLTSHFWPPGLNPWKEMGVRQCRGPVPGEPCAPPAPGTARKREESRAFHGYNKSKGEVRAGEIRNFPTLGTGTCQAAAPGSPRPSLLPPASLARAQIWYMLLRPRDPTCPETSWAPNNTSRSTPWVQVPRGLGPQFAPHGHRNPWHVCWFGE